MCGEKSREQGLWLGPRDRPPASPERGADGRGLELDAVRLKSSVWRANRASPDTPPCRTPPKKRNCREPGLFFTTAWGGGPQHPLGPSGFALGDSLDEPLFAVTSALHD